jgi:hypothetical protein
MTHIREILHRRTDLSTFVVHLTRGRDGRTGLQNLASIARGNRLEAGRALGWAKAQDNPDTPAEMSQRVVCFSETPLEHIHLMLGPMEPGRDVVMEPYGLALTKLAARKLGINPVWYVDITPGRDWTIANALDQLRDSQIEHAEEGGRDFGVYDMARLFPYFEQMGTGDTYQKEFWWEREWRHVGPVTLPDEGVIWLCLANEHDELEAQAEREIRPWIDARWGLEAIIAHLAEIDPGEVSPFAERPAPGPPPF